MKPISKFLAIGLFAFPAVASAQSVLDPSHLSEVKAQLERPYYATAYRALIRHADTLLDAEPLSVMNKSKTPVSGDKHDYMSQARYSWPDPTKPDGRPYITRDGVSNPEINKLDRIPLGRTANNIRDLALAWYFSGDEKYAAKGVDLIKVWFLNKDTRMNPNLKYAQIYPGQNGDNGRPWGLIDTYSFVDMLDGVLILENSKSFKKKDQKALRKWFKEFSDWMLTSKQGKEEGNAANNHSVAYDAQMIAFALYIGNEPLARQIISALPERRIYPQIEPDGSQPHELRRTLAFHYSQYNITHFIDIMLMAQKVGMDIASATSADGRNFFKSIDFLLPYLGKSVEEWPYRQISGWEGSCQNFCKDLYRAAAYLDPSRKDYIKAYGANRVYSPEDLFNLVYVKPSLTDDAYAFATQQLNFAVKCADKARKDEKNAAKRRMIPRSIAKDGSLAMVHPYDWCSGFFGGSLWQVYAYTNDPYWRQMAISWTWPIEEAKWHRGTHDLGFMINNSFGKGYDLTAEQSYRDVVVQSAKSLITRFNSTVGCIRSWDHNRDKWTYPVIIDNLMNLEMLFRATQLTGDSIYWNVAVRHADTTMKNHFRPDYSSYHVVDYNPETGEVRNRCTHQGNSDDSFWSRGQGWGLYGYAMCYRFTHDPRYLRQSEGIADFFINLPNMPGDGVPYWDMKMDVIKDCTPGNVNPSVARDASAAALIASGLYELSGYVAPEKGRRYREHADKILASLQKAYQAEPEGSYGFLLLHSTGHHPAGSEIDVPLNYADYYYLEAMARKAAL